MIEQELCPPGFHLISTCEFAGKPVQDSDGKYVIRKCKSFIPGTSIQILSIEEGPIYVY